MASFFKQFLQNVDDQGQTLVEYVLVVILIAMALIFAFKSARIDTAVDLQAQGIQNRLVTP